MLAHRRPSIGGDIRRLGCGAGAEEVRCDDAVATGLEIGGLMRPVEACGGEAVEEEQVGRRVRAGGEGVGVGDGWGDGDGAGSQGHSFLVFFSFLFSFGRRE